MRVSLDGIRGTSARLGIALVALLGVAACQHTPLRVAAEPSVSAVVVRNASAFEVNVYAVPRFDQAPIWLATIPAKATWQVPVPARALQPEGTLVVKTQAVGASRTWMSAPVSVDNANFGLLDLSVSSSGDCSLSALRSVNAAELTTMM